MSEPGDGGCMKVVAFSISGTLGLLWSLFANHFDGKGGVAFRS